ncbi:hypothetical protein AB833_12210 [Chromatiales bacterium (ex Bugula neritina AB1)]|nr:hypothetical protein AB833_12210 [Chromatiales bacterium (ex Bugula neritina AB1)]
MKYIPVLIGVLASTIAYGHSRDQLSDRLIERIEHLFPGEGLKALQMPASDNYSAIPQDPGNPITSAKVKLGRLLYHETASGTEGTDDDRTETWSCASCHHVAAGFKAGIPQGIGDGGTGFGQSGENRRLIHGLDATAEDGSPLKPDVQPIASPTILNTAYQDLMLWNGSFGNSPGSNNGWVTDNAKAGPAAILANTFGLSGLETQVLAGTQVHRLRFDKGSVLQSNSEYSYLYDQAFPGGNEGYIPSNGTTVTPHALGAAKAIAAYERIVLSNYAPFQRWLSGDHDSLNKKQLRGALLFFGKAKCVSCHTGPALSSRAGASEEEMFFSIGFDDFDPNHSQIHGAIDEATRLGRGGFTGRMSDHYKFKIPQLYNLTDARVLGHGASFKTVREVIEYKNAAIPQNSQAENLASQFRPLGLRRKEISDLTAFIEEALYDSHLDRYVPGSLPSDSCFPMADFQAAIDLGCIGDSDRENDQGNKGKAECQYAGSDPDGDGWGWEDNKSCKMPSDSRRPDNPGGGGKPVCSSPHSDPDGDGWGWENNRSCRVGMSDKDSLPGGRKPVCQSMSSDPDGDGWGWEQGRSCRVVW